MADGSGGTARWGFRSLRRPTTLALASVMLASLTGVSVSAATATQLIVDGGAVFTTVTSVQVAIVATGAEPTELRLANDPTTVDGLLEHGETRPWTPVAEWSLDSAPCPCGDGERTVWGQWRTGDGPWSEPVSDAIALDRTGPTGSVVIDDGAAVMGDPWGWQGSAYDFPKVRLTITVSDAGADIAPRAWAVSRDGVTWQDLTLSAYGTFEYEYDLVGMDVDEGVKTVRVKFRDGAGNWSAPVTDTIALRYNYPGRVVVGDGGGYADSFLVPVRFAVDVLPPEGIASVWVSSNYLGCDDQPYDAECGAKKFTYAPGMTIQWDMRTTAYLGSTNEGRRRVVAWLVSNTGRVSQLEQDWFIIDRAVPVTGPPRPAIATNSVISDTTTSSRVTAVITWTAGGTGSPVAANQLQQSLNSGSWTSLSLTTPNATKATRSLSPVSTYRFRTRSVDAAGNWSSWSTGSTFQARSVQQTNTSIRYTGMWTTRTRSDASGGSLRYARAKGAKASLRFTGRGIAIVAPRSTTGGEMDVYVDGVRVKTAYLSAETYQPRRVVFSKSWSSSGTHTITIVKKYANTDYPISLDAFVILK